MALRRCRPATRFVVAAVAAAAVAAGCSDDSGGQAAPSPSASSAVALPPLRTVDPRDFVGVQSIPWQGARVVSETELDVLYDESPVACRRLSNVRVAETAATVTITVFEGQLRSTAREVCPAIAESARVRVTLRAPLGTRRLLDGSTTPPTERDAAR